MKPGSWVARNGTSPAVSLCCALISPRSSTISPTSRFLIASIPTARLITPEIARLLSRKGQKMVALYGATAEVHDHITRHPGSFEATMQGFAYLKEAGAGFTVQLIPMRDNYHQFDAMVKLAQSLSPHYRIGAAWLYLSACGSRRRNAEIARQRLDPKRSSNSISRTCLMRSGLAGPRRPGLPKPGRG